FDMRFKMVLLSYNALMHFHDQENQIALLTRLRELLDDEGIIIIDLPNAGETFAPPDSEAITLVRTLDDSETGHLVMQQATSYLDRVEQLMRVNWIYDEITGDGTLKRTVAPVIFRYFFYPEVALLLRACDLTVDEVYGSTERDPFEDG